MSPFEIVGVAVALPLTFVAAVGAVVDYVLRREHKRRVENRIITARIDEVFAAAARAEQARREGRGA